MKAFYPSQAALSAAACRHDLEIPRDDRVPRRTAKGWASSCSSISTRTASARGINPVRLGFGVHTEVMKTQGAEAGARQIRLRRRFRRRAPRRGEIARQGAHLLVPHRRHRWDPKNQRPELWRLYNTRMRPGEIYPRISAVQLDRARRLAIHHDGEHSRRAALFRQEAPGGGARRHAHHASTTSA